jgi:hypothetical protein
MPSPTASVSAQTLPRGLNSAHIAHQTSAHDDAAVMPVRLTTAALSSIDYEPVVWVETGSATPPNGCHTASSEPSADFPPMDRLPSFVLEGAERTLDQAVRAQVNDATGLKFNYINQLATFLDEPQVVANVDPTSAPHLTIGYMALVHTRVPSPVTPKPAKAPKSWVSCYMFLPWEDWRGGRPEVIEQRILPILSAWANAGVSPAAIQSRHDQITLNFGSAHTWDDERVLERYELMRAAGLFAGAGPLGDTAGLGRPMLDDHRLVLAAALGRLRSKLRYRPVVFELMAPEFTLFELQRTVEGIIGPHLHKQNFRRLVESMGLVEATGEIKTHTGGRPAKLFRFRPGVVLEQQAPGMRVRLGHV